MYNSTCLHHFSSFAIKMFDQTDSYLTHDFCLLWLPILNGIVVVILANRIPIC